MRNLTGILAALFLGFLPMTLSCGAARRTYPVKGPSLVTTEPEGEYSPNTLIIMYDEAVGKEPLLEAITEDSKQYAEAQRILTFMKYFDKISEEDAEVIPDNAIIREFIGPRK